MVLAESISCSFYHISTRRNAVVEPFVWWFAIQVCHEGANDGNPYVYDKLDKA